mmetsp:Transcript_14219/g.56697  ORF Transcript_14219/g.56697 Transcript_14219/m.56697 type:complete len:138 (+) Transcript_14219:49-462(+)
MSAAAAASRDDGSAASPHARKGPDVSHLTPAQRSALEPEISRLSLLCKCGCACACCTACASLLPYLCYARRVNRLIRRFERENAVSGDDKGDGPLLREGSLDDDETPGRHHRNGGLDDPPQGGRSPTRLAAQPIRAS